MLTEAEIETVESRADVITYTVLAEMEHFQRNRVLDFEVYMQRYLHGQIAFYRQVYFAIVWFLIECHFFGNFAIVSMFVYSIFGFYFF